MTHDIRHCHVPPPCSTRGPCRCQPSWVWPNFSIVSVKAPGIKTGDPLKQQRSSHLTSTVSSLHMPTTGQYSLKLSVTIKFRSSGAGHLVAGPCLAPAASLAQSLARGVPCLLNTYGAAVVDDEAEFRAGHMELEVILAMLMVAAGPGVGLVIADPVLGVVLIPVEL